VVSSDEYHAHLCSGEAGDHAAQSEVDEVNTALYDAVLQNKRGLSSLDSVTNALSMVPGTGGFIQEARDLQAASDAQTAYNDRVEAASGPLGTAEGGPAAGIPGMKVDPQEVIRKIYPILQFQCVYYCPWCI
jgi:Heterokaryon incompatibility protein Het-C